MIKLVDENSPILKQITPTYDFENHPKFSETGESFGLSEFVDSMLVAMQIGNGIGLAAPQIGHSLRIFVMKIDGEEFVCINPEIKEQSGSEIVIQEGCLSFPFMTLPIKRAVEVFVSYQNIEGVYVQRWLNGTAARCFQHELDHLNGVTFDAKAAKLSVKMAKQKRRKTIKQIQRKK